MNSIEHYRGLANNIAFAMGAYKNCYPGAIELNSCLILKIKQELEVYNIYSDDLYEKIQNIILKWLRKNRCIDTYPLLVQYLVPAVIELEEEIISFLNKEVK